MLHLDNANEVIIPLTIDITTTNKDIDLRFGDLISDKSAVALTENEYSAIIQRCIDRGWQTWKSGWEKWRSEGLC